MGIFENIFKPKNKNITINAKTFFKMLNGYTPIFTNAPESLYEMETTKAAIHSFATHCSKLKPELLGTAKPHLKYILENKPNPFTDTTKFLYRTATILAINNTVFIVPIDGDDGKIKGYYPIIPAYCEVVEYEQKPYLRYYFANGQKAAIEFERVGILTQYQYNDDFFGDQHHTFQNTMNLIHTQNEGIISSVKNSAAIRFMAKMDNVYGDETIAEMRTEFVKNNLSKENTSGLIVYDDRIDLKQIDSKPITVNAAQMQIIKNNVYDYFGTNESILQNKFDENQWAAYYEGKIEPFAIQMSIVMSNMTFSQREIAAKNQIFFSANRLQYASNATKLSVSTQLFDRGILNLNDSREIWNKPPVANGDKYFIRREYTETQNIDLDKKGDDNSEPKANIEAEQTLQANANTV